MTHLRKELVKKGWQVRREGVLNFGLKNGPWNGITGFHTEEQAWRWLEKIKEPRSPKDIQAKEDWERNLQTRERSFIKANP